MTNLPQGTDPHTDVKIYDSVDMSNWGYYSYGSHADGLKKFITRLYDPSTPVWVQCQDPQSARYGAIGQAVPAGADPKDPTTWPAQPQEERNRVRAFYDMDVHFDKDRKIQAAGRGNTMMDWLPNYVGGVVWHFRRGAAKPDVEVLDRLGNKLAVGDFVAYTIKGWGGSSNMTLYFGFVKKISKAGIPVCESLKLDDDDVVREERVPARNTICKLNQELLTTLMMKRLTY